MKRNFKLLVLFLIVFLFMLTISLKNGEDTEKFGKVTIVTGKATITKINSDKEEILKINATILLGDTIETFKESKVEILLTDNKTKVIIMENTKVKLSSLLNPNKQKQTIISIFFGTVSSVVTKLSGSTYVIQTPNGSASVRGTDFVVSVSDTMDTVITVNEGIVEYQKEEEVHGVDIVANQYCITEIDSTPQILSGPFDNQTWLNERNSQFEENSKLKSAYVVANIINLIKTINISVKAIEDFLKNSLIMKLLKKKLTPSDLFQFATQKGGLLNQVYKYYYRLNLYDTIALGFYRFFDFLSHFNESFNEQKERCWKIHIELSSWISKILEIYRIIWLFY